MKLAAPPDLDQATKVDDGIVSFQAEGRLLQELGERLVASPEIALVELVKNAYDADSSECEVKLLPDGRLEVTDKGSGMTLEQFQQRWMKIATTHKLEEPTSPVYGRKRTGQKGIGRFAVRFLGNSLQLDTVAYDSKRRKTTRLIADFDWRVIDNAEQLGAANIHYTLYDVPKETPRGTRLRIGELRHSVDFLGSSSFRTSVLKVVSPLESLDRGPFKQSQGSAREDPGFRVVLPGEDTQDDTLDVGRTLLDRAWGQLTIRVTSQKVRFEVKIAGAKRVFTLEERHKCIISKGLHADIRFFPRRAGVFKGSGVNGRRAWTWVRDNCGIAIVDHGFRIRPYGFEDDDWLLLDLDGGHNRRDWRSDFSTKHFPIKEEVKPRPGENPALNLPSNFQLVGAVFVESAPSTDGATNDLIPSMDREGFIENEAFDQLVELVRSGIEFLALVDKNELLRRKEEAAEKAASAVREDFKAAIGNIKKSTTLTKADKARIVEHYSQLSKKLEEVEEYGRDARRKLETMALLGVVAGFMTHEAVRILDSLEKAIQGVRKAASKDPSLATHLTTMEDGYRAFKGHVDYTTLFVDAVHRNDARSFKAAPQIRRVVDRFNSFSRDRGLDIKVDVDDRVTVHGVAVPVYSGVLLNLYTNALKSVLSVTRKASSPQIVFRAWNEDGRHIVEVQDRGVGIPAELRQRVFDPLFTTTSNIGNPLGSGMGLGLSLVREVMGHVGGKIGLVDPPNGYSACFRAEFAGGK